MSIIYTHAMQIEYISTDNLNNTIEKFEKSNAQKDRVTRGKGPATELELGTYVRSITEFQPRAIGPSRDSSSPIVL